MTDGQVIGVMALAVMALAVFALAGWFLLILEWVSGNGK